MLRKPDLGTYIFVGGVGGGGRNVKILESATNQMFMLPPNSYVETLILRMVVFGDWAFGAD